MFSISIKVIAPPQDELNVNKINDLLSDNIPPGQFASFASLLNYMAQDSTSNDSQTADQGAQVPLG